MFHFFRGVSKKKKAITPWTPSQITTALWYDANDSGTITLNGSTVSQWNDKSGNSRNVSQATATSQPTYVTNSLNGKPVLTFDGGDTLNHNTDAFYTSDISFFAVASTTSTTTLQSIISKNQSGNREWYFGVDATNKIFQITNDIGTSSGGDRKAASTGNAGTSYGIWGTSKSGTSVTVSLNGTTNVVTLTTATVFNSASTIQIGNGGGATAAPFNGGIAEIVVVASSLTDTDRQKLEGYLAWKWGLQHMLTSTHPYRYDGTLFGNYPKLWSPSELITALWLDAADTSTITLNGSTVSQWNDKSGNGRHATQATSSNQPTYSTNSLNGKSVLTFDGNDEIRMNRPFSTLGNIFLVQKTSDTQYVTFYSKPNGGNYWAICSDPNNSSSAASLTSGNPTYYVNGASKNWSTKGQVYSDLSVSQTSILGISNVDLTDWSSLSNQFAMGAYESIYNYTGDYAEIIAIPGSISEADRQKIEGYLAHKWGLTANLPAGHPYKTTAPTV